VAESSGRRTRAPGAADEAARSRLAERQAALVWALVAGAAVPAGFDPERVRLAAGSLDRKRRHAVAEVWPGLAEALGEAFAPRFADYAARRDLPARGGPLADGRAFAGWLADTGHLPDAGREQALAVDARFAAGPDGLHPRRWLGVRAGWLPGSRQLLVVAWLNRFGCRWWWLPGFSWRPRAAHHVPPEPMEPVA
jgi:hypothetical protein